MQEKNTERWNPTERALLWIALIFCAVVIGYNLFFTNAPKSSSIIITTYSSTASYQSLPYFQPSGVKGQINTTAPSGTLNLNEASADELAALLPGVGEVLAARIIEYREEKGRFMHVEELLEVKGIGEATLESIKPYLTVS